MAIDGDLEDDESAIIPRLDRDSFRADAWDSAVQASKTISVDDSIALAAKANLIDIAIADTRARGTDLNRKMFLCVQHRSGGVGEWSRRYQE